MSTRSMIAMYDYEDSKKFLVTTCHFDGYIDNGVGELLYTHYNSSSKIKMLITKGVLRTLDYTVANSEYYPEEESLVINTHKELLQHFRNSYCEYLYLFTGGGWMVTMTGSNTVDLGEAIGNEFWGKL